MENLTRLAGKVFGLAGKVFVFNLPLKGKSNKLLKNEQKFIKNVLEIQSCKEIQNVNISNAYVIIFNTTADSLPNEEIISKIDKIAEKIGFEN